MKPESTALYFKSGGSDKVYLASLEQKGKNWIVNFSYGRRGSSLNMGTKVDNTDYPTAKKVYDKLVKEKTSKGYVEDPSGAVFSVGVVASRQTNWIPQLLNPIEVEEVEDYLKNPEFCAQQKFDGRNRLLIRDGKNAIGTNRKGLEVALTEGVAKEVKLLPDGTVLAGEDMGTYVRVFDIISEKNKTFEERSKILDKLINNKRLKYIFTADTAYGELEKRHMYNTLKKDNEEGIVFKHVDAHYTPGRPASGGAQVKFKFKSTASVIVTDITKGKRSIQMSVYDMEHLEVVGNVTVYPNQEIPKIGDIVEVEYLYYFLGGSLFQPVLLHKRDDIDKYDCTLKQLKRKKEEELVS